MTFEAVTLVCTIIGAVGVVAGLILTANSNRKKAASEDKTERDKALREAWDKGWASRNDEVSLLKSQLDIVKHDRDRLERRTEALEDRVLEVGRIERPQLPPHAPSGDS